MNDIIFAAEEKMDKSIESMVHKFTTIRAGRANPAVLDSIMVSYYGSDTPIKQLATISIPEARQLSIKPFDRSVLGAIEKAIFAAEIGLTPNNNGDMIFLVFPPLTEERRRDYVKQVKLLGEDTKVAIRNIRQDTNNALKRLELPKDEELGALEEVQELVTTYNTKVEQLLSTKETELMSI